VLDHATAQANTKTKMEIAKNAQLVVNNAQVEIHAIDAIPILVLKMESAHASLTIR